MFDPCGASVLFWSLVFCFLFVSDAYKITFLLVDRTTRHDGDVLVSSFDVVR